MNGEMDPELLDDEIYRMEQEEPPRLHPTLKYREILPVPGMTEEYKKLHGCYLLPEHGPTDIEPGVCYYTRDQQTRKTQIKALLLKKVLVAPYIRTKLALEGARWIQSSRGAADSQPHAKKITWGFFPQLPGHTAGHGYYSVRSKPTLEQPALAYDLKPLVKAMDACLQEYSPTYYPTALQHALHAEQRDDTPDDDWSRIPGMRLPEHEAYDAKVKTEAVDGPDAFTEERPVDYRPDPVGLVKRIDGPWPGHIYTLWGTVFSTLELNSNIVFKAHEDAHNVKGDLICITALGNWAGGRLIFPRYGIGVDLEPTDLLICDNANELHGNLGPLVGEKDRGRFSVVAFMHSHVLDYANREGLWRPRPSQTVVSVSRQARVWDCHKGKKYPSDAIYVGCRTIHPFSGELLREGTIFGNGKNPLESHKGALASESEFRAYAVEKLKNPGFRAEAEKLRGRDLLCWCAQEGKRREKFCHARVWLELINDSDVQTTTAEVSPDQQRDFDWGYYEPNFLSKEEADSLFEMAKAQPRFRPVIKRSGYPLRRCASTCWSVRDRNDDSVAMVPLSDAPPEIVSLQRKLSVIAGKQVNYFSLQAYENERDHIDFHQHPEDKCRDARVFIISLGERRSFAVDKLCPECLLCDNCNRRRCHPEGAPCSSHSKCQAAKKHRRTCAVRKSTKTILLPAHGSLVVLTSEANDWYEHAVLDDKDSKGLRMSINTKCIPPEDAAAGYVPRELRHGGGFSQ